MGGDRILSPTSSADEEVSSVDHEILHQLQEPPPSQSSSSSIWQGDEAVAERVGNDDVGDANYCSLTEKETNERRTQKVYKEILTSYGEMQSRIECLEISKSKILSYTPGLWIEKVGGLKLDDYDIPKTTTLLLVGPKGSGKSSLVNRISRVLEEKFLPERAQVSCDSSSEDGTYFLHEYMVPRGSTSFCLYDTRGFSDDSSESMKMVQHWMTKGVRHGQLLTRSSDSSSLKARMKYKARKSTLRSCESRMVNFVIFVVNGLSVLKSIENGGAEKKYTKMLATMFNLPFLSFKDDKPVVIITHGDLLLLSERARVRVYLGELLGIPATKQIFDIPESYDPITELTVVDMLYYSLEHADNNFPGKGWLTGKVRKMPIPIPLPSVRLLIILGIAMVVALIRSHKLQVYSFHRVPEPSLRVDWKPIRHLWLGPEYV